MLCMKLFSNKKSNYGTVSCIFFFTKKNNNHIIAKGPRPTDSHKSFSKKKVEASVD